MKKILIINGHPNKNSFCFGIAEAYKKGAFGSGLEVKEIIIRDCLSYVLNNFGNKYDIIF
jgi:putative NADPH-quinone reductase